MLHLVVMLDFKMNPELAAGFIALSLLQNELGLEKWQSNGKERHSSAA